MLFNFKPAAAFFMLTVAIGNPAFACDDTLVMLLTAKNPSSEFSKTIRNFTSDLAILGQSLKALQKDNYDAEMSKVMDSWLEFSKRYMASPPEEARNDLQWAKKTSDTAKVIGEIRRLTSEKKYREAHNMVLDLSSRIGAFFEAFGVSDEKQLFINTSTNLTTIERLVLQNDYQQTAPLIADLQDNLTEFATMIPEIATHTFNTAKTLLASLETGIKAGQAPSEADKTLEELKTAFEELRSHILMREWFPSLNTNPKEKTNATGNGD